MMEKIILLACISLFFLGCGNFLDINPESEVVNDDMFSTAEGVEDRCLLPELLRKWPEARKDIPRNL